MSTTSLELFLASDANPTATNIPAQCTDVTRRTSEDNGAHFYIGTASPHLPIHQYDWLIALIRPVQSALVCGAFGARNQRLSSHGGTASWHQHPSPLFIHSFPLPLPPEHNKIIPLLSHHGGPSPCHDGFVQRLPCIIATAQRLPNNSEGIQFN